MMTGAENPVDLGTIAAWGTGGLSAGAGFYLFRWFLEWFGGRVDKREEVVAASAARNDAATKQIIDTLQGQVREMRAEVDRIWSQLAECRDQHARAEAEVMQLRAMVQGYGDARQDAARIVAADRAEQKGKAND